MKTSNVESVKPVIDAIVKIQPEILIDYGCGSGKYGMLCREYVKSLKFMIGVDTNPDFYKNYNFYDQFWKADIRTCQKLPCDVALIVAVMERLTKEDGIRFLKSLLSKYTIIVFEKEAISTQTQWSVEDFKQIWDKYSIQDLGGEIMFIGE